MLYCNYSLTNFTEKVLFSVINSNYSEGSIPRGVLCEHSSHKTRELRREIMQSMISVHREARNCEGTEQLR